MDAVRFHAIETAFREAHALSGAARAAWLAERDASDPELAAEVRALLRADAATGMLDHTPTVLSSLQDALHAATTGSELPQRVGPYLVSGEIGRGGMAIVCRAHDARLARDVALKIFPLVPAGGAASEVERRVLVEARAASALDHPHICTIYDVGALDDGRPYLAMAYYPGGTLAGRIVAGPIPIREAVSIAHQISTALAAAHTAGIVHRDVKPHNIAFADGGVAKLLDFGIALLRDEGAGLSSAGTPAYMAPEQVRGERPDAHADVWALGVVLYEMLVGRRPFTGPDRAATLRAIVHDDPEDVRTLRLGTPHRLADLVARLLVKTPSQRPNAADVERELRAMLDRLDGVNLSHRFPVRRWLAVGAAAVGLVALAWGVFGSRLLDWMKRSHTADAAVIDLVARAHDRFDAREPQATEQAIALLHSALSRDSTFAPAHALLARAYVFSVQVGQSRESREAWLDSAVAHAQHAMMLAPGDASGHAALGDAYAARGRHVDAIVHVRRALDLAPRDARAMMDLSRSYMALDQFDEAFVWMERALATNPVLPGARAIAVGRYNVWEIPTLARRHIAEGLRVAPEDVELLWQAIILDLREGDTLSARRRRDELLPLQSASEQLRLRAWFEMHRGNPASARPFVDRLRDAGHGSNDLVGYGYVYRLTGERALADSLLRQWLNVVRTTDSIGGRVSSRGAAALAYAHAAVGDHESAFRELARFDSLAGLMGSQPVTWEPGWGRMRDDPRFQKTVERARERFRTSRARIVARLVREGILQNGDG